MTQPYTLPEIVVRADGSFVISASGDRTDGVAVSTDIARRVFAIDGNPIGPAAFEIEVVGPANQITPASARTGDWIRYCLGRTGCWRDWDLRRHSQR